MFLSRGDRDLGVAFQTHPGRQAFISSGSKEPRSALESRRVTLGAHWVDSRESSLLRESIFNLKRTCEQMFSSSQEVIMGPVFLPAGQRQPLPQGSTILNKYGTRVTRNKSSDFCLEELLLSLKGYLPSTDTTL